MFSQIIKDNQERLKNLEIKKRNYSFNEEILELDKIVSFIGPRRVGKTYLMFQFIKELIDKGLYSIEQIVFIDFSVFKGDEINPEDIINSYYSLGNNKKPLLVFDEVQDIENFQKLVLQLYTQGYQIFISGSNSRLLSSELVTEFRGRVYEYFINPLDFDEILNFKDIKKEKKYSSSSRGYIKSIFNDVLKYGNFPELVISKNSMIKTEVLKTYFDILFYKDLTERYSIENEKAIRYLIKRIILSNTKRLNLIKIYNDLQSQGVKIGKNTIYNYYEYLKNIFFVEDIGNFYKKTSNTYLYNFGFGNLFGYADNLGQNFENLIYLNLKRKYNKIFYKEDQNEIDFYLPDVNTNIQVCYELSEENIQREVDTLLKQDGKNILVYFDKKGDFQFDDVEIVDFIDFLNNL
ncbi:ATP-binding protein [Candidatus Absconditicoccus praedator]|uniref:ATP-binding protein n=1 Tax=Candidatus Absconditicoccus praedator TaxID=2735562 RepID=UPI001E4A591B|nr:ATP-binding protein [Candidatus Absconditicoccus praedator]UFX82762.1 ATP-binding protein [Candidatus Absconditicoccus praedator]